MADVKIKISALPGAAALTGAEEIPVVQSASTVKTTVQDILSEVPVSDPVPDSVAADVATLVTDFNNLLAKLKAAGLMS